MDRLEKLKSLALLLLRCALGLIFIYHGYPKLFTHTSDWLKAFPSMGFPSQFAYISGALEFFGGCLLIVGLFTRVAALLLAGEMAVALWKVHFQHGFYAVRDYEFPLVLATAAFTLAALGAGMISLDHPIYGRRSRPRVRPAKD